MKTVTKYQTTDGREWKSRDEAKKHEDLCLQVEEAMKPLGDIPEEVSRGKGWIQHDLETVWQAREDILVICREQGYAEHYPAFNTPGREAHPLSVIGRVLNDNGGPLNSAWNRFMCIDPQGREHQQPYFAYGNGPDSDHVCVEDRSEKQRQARNRRK